MTSSINSFGCTCLRTYWAITVLDPGCTWNAHAQRAVVAEPRLDDQGEQAAG